MKHLQLFQAIAILLALIAVCAVFPYKSKEAQSAKPASPNKNFKKGDICKCQFLITIPPGGALKDSVKAFADWDSPLPLPGGIGDSAIFVAKTDSLIKWRFHYDGEDTNEAAHPGYYIRRGAITAIMEMKKNNH